MKNLSRIAILGRDGYDKFKLLRRIFPTYIGHNGIFLSNDVFRNRVIMDISEHMIDHQPITCSDLLEDVDKTYILANKSNDVTKFVTLCEKLDINYKILKPPYKTLFKYSLSDVIIF